MSLAADLAGWATAYEPTPADDALAQAALADTLAVWTAARGRLAALLEPLQPPGRFAALAHVLDFDDVHLPSTTHVSAVCVPAVLARGGDARAYLAAAGVLARLGTALGWGHYLRGWHATCTAGAPAAAAGAAVALGLDADGVATAIALAVPAAGGVQAAFGTDAKALQVGFAVDAGVRAADLAAAGASADPRAVDQWAALVAGGDVALDLDGPAVPGGLAIKVFPCCYALQRPMQAARALRERLGGRPPAEVLVRTPRSAVQPLRHHAPRTGLEGKFSLEYGVAAALADERIGFATFEDAAVRRSGLPVVRAELADGGDGLLDGDVELIAENESVLLADVRVGPAELAEKAAMCGAPADPSWAAARALVA